MSIIDAAKKAKQAADLDVAGVVDQFLTLLRGMDSKLGELLEIERRRDLAYYGNDDPGPTPSSPFSGSRFTDADDLDVLCERHVGSKGRCTRILGHPGRCGTEGQGT